jgi:hypothetical protein
MQAVFFIALLLSLLHYLKRCSDHQANHDAKDESPSMFEQQRMSINPSAAPIA